MFSLKKLTPLRYRFDEDLVSNSQKPIETLVKVRCLLRRWALGGYHIDEPLIRLGTLLGRSQRRHLGVGFLNAKAQQRVADR